jgi:hypothetical protein
VELIVTFLPWVVFRSGDLAFVTGQSVTFRLSRPVLRTFCGKCGMPLTYQHDENLNTIDVTTSTLDLPESFAPTREISIEHKLSWEALSGSRQHFPRSRAAKKARTSNRYAALVALTRRPLGAE